MLSRKDILLKTNYGFRIYSAILRMEYPEDDVVLHIVGRDCDLARNPYDDGNKTLHIWREKLHPDQKLSDELARHHDLSGNLPDGDCFAFAERYFGLKDQALLEHLNEVLHLHIDDPYRQYEKTEKQQPEEMVAQPVFSFFKKPITNATPLKDVTLKEIYEYIAGPTAKDATAFLRTIENKKEARDYKAKNFDYCTFSASFSYRDEQHLTQLSGLMSLDFDHLPDVEGMFRGLLNDKYFETLLLFRSPSGDGLKWIIPVDYQGHSHREVFRAVSNYIQQAYHVKVDQNCQDPTRPCYLPHDAEAYLSPQLK